MKKRIEKFLKNKNNIWFLILVTLSLGIVIYALAWHQEYTKYSLSNSNLVREAKVVNLEEVKNHVAEEPRVLVYYSLVDDENDYILENEIYDVLKKYHLEGITLYVNTELSTKNHPKEELPGISYYDNHEEKGYATINSKADLENLLKFLGLDQND